MWAGSVGAQVGAQVDFATGINLQRHAGAIEKVLQAGRHSGTVRALVGRFGQ